MKILYFTFLDLEKAFNRVPCKMGFEETRRRKVFG